MPRLPGLQTNVNIINHTSLRKQSLIPLFRQLRVPKSSALERLVLSARLLVVEICFHVAGGFPAVVVFDAAKHGSDRRYDEAFFDVAEPNPADGDAGANVGAACDDGVRRDCGGGELGQLGWRGVEAVAERLSALAFLVAGTEFGIVPFVGFAGGRTGSWSIAWRVRDVQ